VIFLEKKDIIKVFMEKGILLSPQEINDIDESNYMDVLEKRTKPKEIPKEKNKESQSIEKQPIEKNKETQLDITVKEYERKKEMTPQDFVDYFNKRYEGIRDLLSKKINPVSINKAKGLLSSSTIIGVVKERAQNGFVVEDQTDSVEVISKIDPPIGDVFSITGTLREGKFFEKEIIYPDVPLVHKPRSLKGEIIISKKDGEVTITSDSITKTTKPPSHVTISRDGKELFIFIYEPAEPIKQNDVTKLLKKRHISPKIHEILYDEDPFLLDPVPDVVFLFGDEEYVKNYKGVTVISTGKKQVKINLETKKAEFVD